jgi:hypothetical protein
MTISYSQFFTPVVLTTSEQTIYTVPTNPTTNLLRGGRIRFANSNSSAVQVSAYAIPANSFAETPGNIFAPNLSVPANSFIDVDVPLMGPGDFIQAIAGINSAITLSAINGALFS